MRKHARCDSPAQPCAQRSTMTSDDDDFMPVMMSSKRKSLPPSQPSKKRPAAAIWTKQTQAKTPGQKHVDTTALQLRSQSRTPAAPTATGTCMDPSATCPLCSVLLASISDTDAGKQAHVESCLNACTNGDSAASSSFNHSSPLRNQDLNAQAPPVAPCHVGKPAHDSSVTRRHSPQRLASGCHQKENVPLVATDSAAAGVSCCEHALVEASDSAEAAETGGCDEWGDCGHSDGADEPDQADVAFEEGPGFEMWEDEGEDGGQRVEKCGEEKAQAEEGGSWPGGTSVGSMPELQETFERTTTDPSSHLGMDSVGLGSNTSSISSWLMSLGLQQYGTLFDSAEVDMETVPHLTDEDLQELGVNNRQHRATILLEAATAAPAEGRVAAPAPPSGAIKEVMAAAGAVKPVVPGACDERSVPHPWLASPHPAALRGQQQQQQQQQLSIDSQQPRKNLAGGSGSTFVSLFNQRPADPDCSRSRITSYFSRPGQTPSPPQQPGAAQGPNLVSAPGGAGSRHAQPLRHEAQHGRNAAAGPSTVAVRQAGQAPGGGGKQLQQQQGQPRQWQPGAPPGSGLSRRVPSWHTIPGTRFLVDLFSPASRDIRGCNYWILTHFHADHYKGLTKGFSQGQIVCSPVTAQLISTKLKVPWARICVVPLDTPTVLEGTTVTLIEANHCPGAAMVVAEPPNGPPVLHTGDARLVAEMQQHPVLQRLVGKAILILDTTYCDPQYTFATQAEVLKFTQGAVNTEKFNARTLFLFGTYTIGKERLFLEVARSLGNKKVYVSKEKMAILQCCNLAPAYANLLTTNHLEANIHAVPLFKINADGMTEIMSRYKGRYTSVVGFSPTGWSHGKEQHKGKIGKRSQRGSVIIYQVPYSEHSSFAELRSFVSWLRPITIIPSVGNDNGGPKAKSMCDLLTRPMPKGQPTIASLFKTAAQK